MSSSTSTKPRDRDDRIEQEGVEPDDVVHHRRRRLLEADLPVRRLPERRPRPRHGPPSSAPDRYRHGGQPLEHEHRRHRSFDEAVIRRIVSSHDAKHDDTDSGSSHPERSVRQGGVWAGRAAGPLRESRQSQNHNSGLLAMHLVMGFHAVIHASLTALWVRAGHDRISATMRCSTVPLDARVCGTMALDFSLWKRVTSTAGRVVGLRTCAAASRAGRRS